MISPARLQVDAPTVTLAGLQWGVAEGAPIALCLHGFPDTAHTWRFVAPQLAQAGWRVVAPFMRGYAPSTIPTDGSYHVSALMDDALRVLDAVGPTGRDVVIGHDWGAAAASSLAAMPDAPFDRAVVMSLPPFRAFRPLRGVGLSRSLPVLGPGQLLKSWYILYHQLPLLPEKSKAWIVDLLWRRWSPGYDGAADVALFDAATDSPAGWRAALGPYRHVARRAPEPYAAMDRYLMDPPLLPTLYMHGVQDGCMGVKLAERVRPILPPDSGIELIDGAGHFVQLEQPDAVAGRILDFIGRP